MKKISSDLLLLDVNVLIAVAWLPWEAASLLAAMIEDPLHTYLES
jgi:hypothetical protein